MSFYLMKMTHVFFNEKHITLSTLESFTAIMWFLMQLKIRLIWEQLPARARLTIYNLFKITSKLRLTWIFILVRKCFFSLKIECLFPIRVTTFLIITPRLLMVRIILIILAKLIPVRRTVTFFAILELLPIFEFSNFWLQSLFLLLKNLFIWKLVFSYKPQFMIFHMKL